MILYHYLTTLLSFDFIAKEWHISPTPYHASLDKKESENYVMQFDPGRLSINGKPLSSSIVNAEAKTTKPVFVLFPSILSQSAVSSLALGRSGGRRGRSISLSPGTETGTPGPAIVSGGSGRTRLCCSPMTLPRQLCTPATPLNPRRRRLSRCSSSHVQPLLHTSIAIRNRIQPIKAQQHTPPSSSSLCLSLSSYRSTSARPANRSRSASLRAGCGARGW